MAVEDRPAEGDMFSGVAVASQRHVPAGEQKLKLAGAGLADQRDRLAVPESARVVLELLVEPGMPFRGDQLLEDVANQPLLLAGEKTARHVGFGGIPVVCHPRAEQAEFRVHMIPGKTDLFPLLRRERGVQQAGERLGRFLRDGGGSGLVAEEMAGACGKREGCRGGARAAGEEMTTRQGLDRRSHDSASGVKKPCQRLRDRRRWCH